MAERAQVTSIEAIESFRSNLIVFLSKARPAVEEVSNEVMRARLWVQGEQRKHWENQLRLRMRKLERAQAELSSARMSIIQTPNTAQLLEVQRAQRAVREAEAKLALLRKWDRELENRSEPLLKQVEQLHGFLSSDMAKAIAALAQTVKALEAYADVARGGPMPATGTARTEDSAGERNPGGTEGGAP
jgi:hypothetical protein